MSYVFKRQDVELSFNAWDWSYLVSLAQRYGWERGDADDPVDKPEVSAEEAAKLAAVLRRALEDIPDQQTIPSSIELSTFPENPLDWFSGDGKQTVIEFAEFCRGGAFAICAPNSTR